MYLIFNYFVQNLSIFSFGLVMSFTLTPKYSRVKSLFLFQFFFAVLYIFKMIYFSNAMIVFVISTLSQAISYLFALIAFKDSVFKKLLTPTCFILFSLLAEYMTLWLLPDMGHPFNTLTVNSKLVFIYSSVAICIQIVLSLFFLFGWRYLTQKKAPAHLLRLSLIPMFQIVILITVLSPFFFGDNAARPIYITMGILVALLSNFVLLYYILRKHEKKTIQDAYLELQELYAMNLKYYEELESQHEILSKIRHDYQNQLATLYMLISSNKITAAQEFIDSLQSSLNEIYS